MTHFLRGVVLSLALTCAGTAATITFSGIGVGGTGSFALVGGQTVTGSVTILSTSVDQNIDEGNNDGEYILNVGSLAFSVSNFGQFSFVASQFIPVTLRTFNNVFGADRVEVEAFGGPFGTALLTLFGDASGQFVTAPAGANGVDALNSINWANFATGNLSISTVMPTSETSVAPAFEVLDGTATFVIDNATNVPEPGTALVVLAGVAAIWMKRRSA